MSTPASPPPPPSPAQLGLTDEPQPGAATDPAGGPGTGPALDQAPWPVGPPPTTTPRTGGDTLAWWGFGLSFGSVLAALAGAALALSVLGVLAARRTGRAMVPAVIGCAIAGLALVVHTGLGAFHGVQWVVALGQGASGPDGSDGSAGPGGSGGSDQEPSYTDAEQNYLDVLLDSQSEIYYVYTDLALVGFGHQACDAVDGGEDAEQAAADLDMGSAAAAEVVQVATDVLCPAGDPPPSGS